MTFSPWPSYSHEEIQKVSEVLRSNRVNYWTGEECRNFESEFADFCQVKHAVAVANGSLALELALRVLGIRTGDEVVVASRTFIASASSIVNVGATPVFADVDCDSQNITPSTIREVITKKTRAIICVHLAGWPCDMDGIMDLAREFHIKVVEDCAQAHGALYKGRPVGGLGDVAAFSFCQDKIISTGGEGGMLTTNNHRLWESAWAYKDHGKSYAAVYRQSHPSGFRWLHESFGSNWRLTEMQAAIGRIQLRLLKAWHELRLANAMAITQACESLIGEGVLRVPFPSGDTEHAFYKFYLFVDPTKLADDWSRDRIIQEINAQGVPCFQGTCSEVYLEKAFDGTTFRPSKRLPIAMELAETSLMFLCHPTLTKAEINKTCLTINEVFKLAVRNPK